MFWPSIVHLIMISMIISYVILYVYLWKGENFPANPPRPFSRSYFFRRLRNISGNLVRKTNWKTSLSCFCITLYIWTLDLLILYIIVEWTLDPLDLGRLIQHLLIYYCWMDTWSIRPWMFNPTSLIYYCGMDTRSIRPWI